MILDKQVICDYCMKIVERTAPHVLKISFNQTDEIVSIKYADGSVQVINVRGYNEIRTGARILQEIK